MTSIYDVLKASKGIHVDDTFAELWGRKLSNAYTVATYTGTLPATLQTVEGYLESYKIYGNTVQDGTPTPENPIVPSECGERTENLFDIESWLISKEAVFSKDGNAYTFSAIQSMYSTPFYFSDTDIPVSISGIITDITAYNTKINLIRADGTIAKSSALTYLTNVKKSENIVCAGLQIDWSKIGTIRIDSLMLNLGSTALPYEPYGYKLPLTVNGVEYPIYFGESQTTRKIKKLVLTGEENWVVDTFSLINTCLYRVGITDLIDVGNKIGLDVICTHFECGRYYSVDAEGLQHTFKILYFRTVEKTLENWKTYLAAQYANGTPVTVWYVLATEKTAVVNEPLMKIGDYADTIDSTQAMVQIPTTAGETTISWAGEGLAPSEVELTYRKRKGQ